MKLIVAYIVRKKSLLIVFLLSFLLVGCSTSSQNIQKDLLLSKSGYITSKTIAYQWFGVGKPHLFSGPNNVTKSEPTKFHISTFVVDNEGCEIIYFDKNGKQLESIKSSSLDGYLSSDNTLIKIICSGKESNIDYKIQVTSDGSEYVRSGSLYYFGAK